ncbi:hypothetical protein HDV57DRAFT_460339 [Trichoderma longibrachiatum]
MRESTSSVSECERCKQRKEKVADNDRAPTAPFIRRKGEVHCILYDVWPRCNPSVSVSTVGGLVVLWLNAATCTVICTTNRLDRLQSCPLGTFYGHDVAVAGRGQTSRAEPAIQEQRCKFDCSRQWLRCVMQCGTIFAIPHERELKDVDGMHTSKLRGGSYFGG